MVFATYAALGRNIAQWALLAWWVLQGAFAGAAAGLVVYGAIVVLRVALVVLGIAIKIAFFAALVAGALYLLRGWV